MNISCPFCNHNFAPDSTARPMCPRCGEMIPSRGRASAPRPKEPDLLAAMVKSRLKQGAVVLFLIFAAIAGFAFWKVNEERKKNQFPPPPIEAPANAAVAPPLQLRGLGYLPSNCNVVFAVQPGPLLAFAEKSKQDPVELLTKNRVPASALGTLAKAGITLQDIDHIAGGLYVPDKNEELRIAFVLVLRRSPDQAKFLDGLKAKPGANGYDVSFDKFTVRMKRVSGTEWVFGLSEKDFGDGTSLSPAMRDVVESRVPKDAAVWAATAGEKWNEKPLMAAFGKDALGPLAKGRAAAFGYTFGDRPTLHLAVRSTDAESLRTRFKGMATGENSSAGGADDWATLEKPIDPADVFSQVKRMFE